MRSVLYIIAVMLVVGWVLGMFVWKVNSGLIHILILLAIISLLFGIIRKA